MARTQFVDTPDELKNLALKAHQRRDRFILGVVQGQRALPSRRQASLLRRTAVVHSPMEGRGSLFKYLSPFWRSLTSTQKAVWKTAGAYSSISGWQLFLSDNSARIKNSLTVGVPPSNLWQVRAGYVVIESPASEILLKQEHPLDYWTSQKIPGRPWKSEIVLLRETFSLPLTISIRYKTNLSTVGGTQRARFFARVWTSYQGQDIETDFAINFSASADWTLGSISTSGLRGIIVGYTLFLDVYGYTGTLLFDNIEAVHGGTNWARDPRCDDVSKIFKKAFAVIPPFWVPVSLPSGSSFSSQFPPAL